MKYLKIIGTWLFCIQFILPNIGESATLFIPNEVIKNKFSHQIAIIRSGKKIGVNPRGTQLSAGDIVMTTPFSSARIKLDGNGIIFLAPDSEILVGEKDSRGIQFFSLIDGELFFRKLKTDSNNPISNREAGALITVRDTPRAHSGEQYRLSVGPNTEDNFIEVIQGQLKIYEVTESQMSKLYNSK